LSVRCLRLTSTSQFWPGTHPLPPCPLLHWLVFSPNTSHLSLPVTVPGISQLPFFSLHST
jgi:hypothetical protein